MLSSIYSALTQGPSVRVKSDKESTTVPVLKVLISTGVGENGIPITLKLGFLEGLPKFL